MSSAQEIQALPPAATLPLHSVMDVATLPLPDSADLAGAMRAPRPRLRLRPDPEALASWKAQFAEMPRAAASGSLNELAVAPRATAPSAPASVITAFEGLTNDDNAQLTGFTVVPPDANLAVGPNHVFQMVNIVGRTTDKRGGNASSFALASFFALDPGADETDPRVIYDAQSGHWFATYAQSISGPGPSGSSSIVLAVSATSDPTGAFCLYRLGNPSAETFIQDFPQLGVSADKVIVAYNGFSFAGAQPLFIGAGYYVLDKADLAACSGSPHVVRSAPTLARFNPHPVQTLDGTSTLFIAVHTSKSALTVLGIDGVPGVSSVTETPTALPIRSWVAPPNAVQPGSGVRLDTGDDGVLSGALRDNSLWVAGNEACTPAGDTQARSCLRVIEVRTDSMSVREDMTLGTSSQYYYDPALRPDVGGNLQMVFNASSSTDFAGLRISGRLAGDPLNALQAPTLLRAGGGAQTDNSGRMGDYSGAAVDPVDPRTVWVHGEYTRSTAARDWGTYVAALMFPFPPPTASLVLSKPGAASTTGLQFGTGDTLQADLTVSNPGPALVVDVFFGVLAPPAAGPALGCPNDDPVVFFANNLTTSVLRCLSSPPQSFPPLFQSATLPAGLAPATIASFFSLVWPAAAPAGPYTFFFAFTTPGAFAYGVVAPGDLIAVTTAGASFSP